jgi:hypothetical protein
MNENEKAEAIDTSCRLRERTNATVIAEIAIERANLDANIQKLKKAIAADPEKVAVSQKALWKVQLNAMNDYKNALGARIIDLINSDK